MQHSICPSASNYTVSFGSAEVAQDLYVQNDNVTLNLNSSGASLNVGGTLGVGMQTSSGTATHGNLTITHSIGGASVNISAGSVVVGSNGSIGTLTIASGLNLAVSGPVCVGAGSLLVIKPGARLFTQQLTIAGSLGAWTGKLDIGTGALDLADTTLQIVNDQVTQGFNIPGGGNWQGSGGITSSSAAANSGPLDTR